MPGAKDALHAVSCLDGTVQSVLTGTIRSNAVRLLTAFGLHKYVDLEVGGYGEEVYPKAGSSRSPRGGPRTSTVRPSRPCSSAT